MRKTTLGAASKKCKMYNAKGKKVRTTQQRKACIKNCFK